LREQKFRSVDELLVVKEHHRNFIREKPGWKESSPVAFGRKGGGGLAPSDGVRAKKSSKRGRELESHTARRATGLAESAQRSTDGTIKRRERAGVGRCMCERSA